MKTFTNTGNINSFDIVHMVGNKDSYTITENEGKLTYESASLNRKYIVDNVEEMDFKYSNGVSNNFKWSDEFSPFSRISCKEWLNSGAVMSGIYTIRPNGYDINVYCDMTTDGGGWTLVSYAGTIDTNKEITSGQPEKFFQPIIFNWGNIQTDSLNTKTSFSRIDIFNTIMKPTDEIMSKRTSNNNNIIIFPIMNTDWFGRDMSEGQFNITAENRNISYLKLSNSGNNGFKTVSNNTKWSYLDNDSGNYPGIDWNVPEGDNCDNCGRDYSTGLNHRSLLYWDISNSGYSATQWFHGSPLSLTDGTGPSNLVQDVEFWFREA